MINIFLTRIWFWFYLKILLVLFENTACLKNGTMFFPLTFEKLQLGKVGGVFY